MYALEELPAQPLLKTMTFAAPDVDVIEFRNAILSAIGKGLAERTTVYVCERDLPLHLSRRLHSRTFRGDAGRGRAGQAGELLAPVPGTDTVDVSLVEVSPTFHGYAGTNRTVLVDLYLSIVHALPPSQRNLYRATTSQGLPFWLIRP
jgi:hypothetical protein